LTADNKYNWIGEAPTPWMYLSQRQEPPPRSTLIIATTGNAAQLASPLRALVRDLDPTMPIGRVRTMEEYYYGNATSLVTTLVGVTGTMGLLGLALAVVGLYGLVAHVVARRTREIGIRIAVGAPSGAVRRMVLRYGLMLATAGTLLGLAASVPLQRLARGVFPNTQSVDLVTYLLVVPTLVVVVMLAAYVPARRASRIDPLIALRQE
jgi:predicted lysophospholipase L1 biosynthesis ABC-type transport system permease subunit